MADYAKLQRQNPQIKPCVVSIEREAHIEAMLSANNLPIRRSQRLAKKQMNESSKPATVTKKPATVTKKRSTRQTITGSACTSNALSLNPKSILVGEHKSRLRARSKSVSFDPHVLSPKPTSAVGGVKTSRMRGRSKSVCFDAQDLSSKTSSASCDVASTTDFVPVRRVSLDASLAKNRIKGTNKEDDQGLDAADVFSLRILDYENRIDGLVASNQTKISRIQELHAERDTLLDQIRDLHRLNLILTKGLDDLRAEMNNQAQGSPAGK